MNFFGDTDSSKSKESAGSGSKDDLQALYEKTIQELLRIARNLGTLNNAPLALKKVNTVLVRAGIKQPEALNASTAVADSSVATVLFKDKLKGQQDSPPTPAAEDDAIKQRMQ